MAMPNTANVPALQHPSNVDEWKVVIKVKYGDTLRRFGANIYGRSMDHNMSSIRAKIIELFKIGPEADLILTYIDEDGDSVALEEDEELNDAVISQRLDPLRINVQLKTVESSVSKISETADSTQSLSQMIETTLHTNPAVAEALKSVPEPLRAIVSEVSQDLAVKASSIPALAQLIQLYGPGSPSGPVGGSSSASCGPTNSATGQPKSAVVPVPETANNSDIEPMIDTTLHTNPAVAEALKSVPEPLRAIVSKVSQDLVVKASSIPALAQLIQLYGPGSPSRPVGRSLRASSGPTNSAMGEPKSAIVPVPETANNSDIEPMIDTTLHTNPAVAEALKSVPEPLRAIVSKVSQDLALKASSIPALAHQLIQLYGPGSPSRPVGGSLRASSGPTNSATGEPKSAIVPVPETANNSDIEPISKQKGKASIAQGSIVATPTPVDLNLDPPRNQLESELPSPNGLYDSDLTTRFNTLTTKLKEGLQNKGRDAPGWKSTVESPAAPAYQFPQANSVGTTEVPVGWTTMEFRTSPRSSRMPLYYHRSLTRAHSFHRGVQCRGCGMYPITGPRFKSVVKENYDLCRYCFSNMGNEVEYTRMERPASQCPYFIGREAQQTHGRYTGPLRPPKLESLFVKDVTVIDGTVMPPCTPFTKIWRMRNIGTIAWPLGTHLLWTGGSPLGTRESFSIEVANNGCPVNHEIDIAIDLTSPSEPGSYTSFWSLVTSSGETFGQRIWVQIEVEKPKTISADDGFQHYLNLNLPPQISDLYGIIDMNAVPSGGAFAQTTFPEPWDMPVVAEPTIESLAPQTDVPMASEVTEMAQSEAAAAANSVEQAMLKELEAMGFMHFDLNKEVLRENEYDLEQSVDELCDLAEWDPVLTELQGMGFHDKKLNKKLLVKNGGSIKRVVLDLISGEEKDE